MRTKASSQVGGVKIFVLWVFISVIVGSIAFAVERTKYAPGVTVKIGTYATLSGTAELNGTGYKCLEGFTFYSDGLCRGNELVNGKRMTLAQSGRPCPSPAYRNSGERHCTHEPIRLEPVRIE